MKSERIQHFYYLRMMPKLRRIYRKCQKHWTGFMITVFILAISIYLYNKLSTAENESKNINDLIISFSAVATVFFMYLTFRQTKISNDIKYKEADFNRLYRKVNNCRDSLNKPIIFIAKGQLNHTELDNITYGSFLIPLFQYITNLKRTSEYDKCNRLFNGTDSIDFNGVEPIILELQNFKIALLSIHSYYFELSMLINEIDSSECHFLQKKALVSDVFEIYKDYYSSIYSYHSRDTFYQEVLNPVLIEHQYGKLIRTRNCTLDDISKPLIDIRYKTEKYLDS